MKTEVVEDDNNIEEKQNEDNKCVICNKDHLVPE